MRPLCWHRWQCKMVAGFSWSHRPHSVLAMFAVAQCVCVCNVLLSTQHRWRVCVAAALSPCDPPALIAHFRDLSFLFVLAGLSSVWRSTEKPGHAEWRGGNRPVSPPAPQSASGSGRKGLAWLRSSAVSLKGKGICGGPERSCFDAAGSVYVNVQAAKPD